MIWSCYSIDLQIYPPLEKGWACDRLGILLGIGVLYMSISIVYEYTSIVYEYTSISIPYMHGVYAWGLPYMHGVYAWGR